MAEINVEKQLLSAMMAVSVLSAAGVPVLAVTLSRETNRPYILVDGRRAQDVILQGKLGSNPGTYESHMTSIGFISETWKVEFLGCVVQFSFLSLPKNIKVKSDATSLN